VKAGATYLEVVHWPPASADAGPPLKELGRKHGFSERATTRQWSRVKVGLLNRFAVLSFPCCVTTAPSVPRDRSGEGGEAGIRLGIEGQKGLRLST